MLHMVISLLQLKEIRESINGMVHLDDEKLWTDGEAS